MTSARRETEFEAPGLYAVTAPRLENELPRCAFPEGWHCQTLSLATRTGNEGAAVRAATTHEKNLRPPRNGVSPRTGIPKPLVE